jgi:hypothetical protein
MDQPQFPSWDDLVDEDVVVDMGSAYVYVGRLAEHRDDFLLLADADVHDLRDTRTTRENYIRGCREHGVHANRNWVWVNKRDVVSISRLADVRLD